MTDIIKCQLTGLQLPGCTISLSSVCRSFEYNTIVSRDYTAQCDENNPVNTGSAEISCLGESSEKKTGVSTQEAYRDSYNHSVQMC